METFPCAPAPNPHTQEGPSGQPSSRKEPRGAEDPRGLKQVFRRRETDYMWLMAEAVALL